MTSKTTDQPDANVTEISTAKGGRTPARNRTARRQQLDAARAERATAKAEAEIAAGEQVLVDAITPDARADETRADAERAGLSPEATESLVAAQAAALDAGVTPVVALTSDAAEQLAADSAAEGDAKSDEQPATPDKPAKPARARAERVARVDVAGDVVPEGYLALKDTPSYRQFRKADPNAEGAEWLTQCVKHGKTTTAKNRKEGRAKGSTSERVLWCSGCKADAKKAEAAKAKATTSDEPAAPATSSEPSEPTSDATSDATSESSDSPAE